MQRGLERDGYDFFLSESYRWTLLDEELALRLDPYRRGAAVGGGA